MQISEEVIPSSSFAPAKFGVWGRVLLLAALASCELIALSLLVDTQFSWRSRGLWHLIGDSAPLAARIVIVASAVILAAAWSRRRGALERIEKVGWNGRYAWPALAGHAVLFVIFAAVSASFLNSPQTGASSVLAPVVWFASGLGSGLFAAAFVLPLRVWAEILNPGSDAYICAGLAGAATGLLAIVTPKLWAPAIHLTFACVRLVLQPLFSQLVIDPAHWILGTQRFQVAISGECSGLEGIGLVAAFGSLWLFLFRRDYLFPRSLLLLPAGMAAVWVLNVFRIAALILIGHSGATAIAVHGFHSQAGWIAFNAVAVGFCLGAERLQWARVSRRPQTAAQNPTVPYLLPFVAILAAGMISRIWTHDSFEGLYGLRVLAAAAALWLVRRPLARLDWRFGWEAVAAGTAAALLWLGLDLLGGKAGASAIPPALSALTGSGRITWIALRVVGAVLTVPVAEELAFRGFLIRRLISADFELLKPQAYTWPALLISSLLFGLLHQERWLAGTLCGLLYGALLVRRGRIGDAAAAHATTNALIAVWVLATGSWQLW